MQQDKRRYFVAEDGSAEDLKEAILAKVNAQHEQHKALALKYGADQVLKYNDGRVIGLAFKSDGGDAPERDGLAFERSQPGVDTHWHTYKPNRKTKLGKEIARDMGAIQSYSASDTIVSHYDAHRHCVVPHAGRTGMAMAMSAGGIIKGKVVLSVPVNESEPFDPPVGLCEIKKSEWIALTEE